MTSGAPPTIPAAAAAAPSELQQKELAAAQQLYRPIKRAGRTACFSAVSTLLIASIAVVVVLFSPDFFGVLSALALGAIGCVEWVGYRRLLRGQPSAAVLLMRNQLAFLTLIILYCGIQMATFSKAAMKDAALSPEDRAALSQTQGGAAMLDQTVDKLAPIIQYGFYSLVIVLSIAFQGGLAFYYKTRRKYLVAFCQSAPPWAQTLVLQANSTA